MKTFAILVFASATLGACAVIPNAPNVDRQPHPAGYAVPFDQPVQVGDLVLTPKSVVEDSRCPANARCMWAGRAVVRTRIDGAGWRETKDLTLGETYDTHNRRFALVQVLPEKMTGDEIASDTYRFRYEAR
jgi:hypothetical protein